MRIISCVSDVFEIADPLSFSVWDSSGSVDRLISLLPRLQLYNHIIYTTVANRLVVMIVFRRKHDIPGSYRRVCCKFVRAWQHMITYMYIVHILLIYVTALLYNESKRSYFVIVYTQNGHFLGSGVNIFSKRWSFIMKTFQILLFSQLLQQSTFIRDQPFRLWTNCC